MPELTQRMIDAGATFFDQNGIPTRPDGTPALEENQGRGGLIDAMQAIVNPVNPRVQSELQQQAFEAATGESVNVENSLGFGYGPPYTPSPQDYPENRTPMTLPEGLSLGFGETGTGNWEDYHTPQDRSSGGGFFTAYDLFGQEVPWMFQTGASSPSTNNYRLLPVGYRTPDYVMRNGFIINRRDLRPPGFLQSNVDSFIKGEGMGYPSGIESGRSGSPGYGWPGAQQWTIGPSSRPG